MVLGLGRSVVLEVQRPGVGGSGLAGDVLGAVGVWSLLLLSGGARTKGGRMVRLVVPAVSAGRI